MSTEERCHDTEHAHPVIEDGVPYTNTNGPVKLRASGNSLCQTVPQGVDNFLSLTVGDVPQIVVHPDLNAITFVYDEDISAVLDEDGH